jgi:hypothetical protein
MWSGKDRSAESPCAAASPVEPFVLGRSIADFIALPITKVTGEI